MPLEATEDAITESMGAEYPSFMLIKWVFQMALMGLSLSDRFDDLKSDADYFLQRFQPPESSGLLGLSIQFTQGETR